MSNPDRSSRRDSETSGAAFGPPAATCTPPASQGSRDSSTTTTTSPLHQVHSLVISRLRDRLVKSNLQFDPQEVSATGLNFLFETVGGDLGAPESFAFASYERATSRHYLLSDQELARVLALVESTSTDPNPPEDEHVTYVRSWALQVEELALLVEAWVQAGIAVPESWSWLVDAFAADDPRKLVYVRYVGSTRGQTPYKRFKEDLRERKTGMMGEFLGTLLEVAPRAYEHGKTFEIRNARLPSSASPAARDLREQVMIAFFGRHNLLNVQAGGFYASYAPDPSDIEFLKSPTSRFFQNFAQWSKPVPRAMIEQLKHWRDYVADLIASNPQSTRSAVLPLPAKTLDTIFGQAVPSQIGGIVPMVYVGLDITLESYLDGTAYLQGNCRTGHITVRFAERHAGYELGREGVELDKSVMPFVDLFPWPCKVDIDLGLAQLTNYLVVVLPILVVTSSHLAFSCAMANWLHPLGIRTDAEFFSHVGKVHRRYILDNDYLEDGTQLEPPGDREVLVIGHIDPGFDKYGAQPQELRRVFDICHAITWFVAGVVVEKSHLLAQGRPDGRADRAAVIDEVMKTLDSSSRFSDLEQKRDEWVAEYQLWAVEHRAQYRPRMGTAVASTVRKAGARRRVSNVELAWGDVGSAERRRQLIRVWKLQNPEYFLCLERPVTWEKWEQWGGGVTKGNSFFATALAQAGRQRLVAQGQHPLRSVLLAFTPDDATDESWMTDSLAVQRALSAWSRKALAHLPTDHWSSKKQRARTLKKGTIFLDRLEGEVAEFNFSNRKCEILLRRRDAEVDDDFTFRLRVSPSFAPRAQGERRILHFLPEGVGLEDENGNFLQRDGFTPEEGIFRARDAVLGHRGDVFARIFAAERAALAPAAPARTTTATSTSTNTLAATTTGTQLLLPPTGEPPVTATARKQKRTEAREQDISPGDGVWLLKQWVDWRCGFEKPTTFNTLDPSDARLSTDLRESSIATSFVRFLQQEPYASHPWKQRWLDWCNDIKLKGKNIVANLELFRVIQCRAGRVNFGAGGMIDYRLITIFPQQVGASARPAASPTPLSSLVSGPGSLVPTNTSRPSPATLAPASRSDSAVAGPGPSTEHSRRVRVAGNVAPTKRPRSPSPFEKSSP